MEKDVITQKAVRQVIKDYWQQYKLHRAYTAAGFVLPADFLFDHAFRNSRSKNIIVFSML